MESKARTGGRVLLVDECEASEAGALKCLWDQGYDVSTIDGPGADAREYIIEAQPSLVIVTLHLEDRERTAAELELARWVGTRSSQTGTEVLVLTRARSPDELQVLFQQGELLNFLALEDGAQFDEIAFASTVAKAFNDDIFGVEKYLASGFRSERFTIRDSAKRGELIDRAVHFAINAGCPQRAVSHIALAIDESVSNAIYNAPVNAVGARRFSHLPRTQPVLLEEHEGIDLVLASDGQRLCFSTQDPFGSLPVAVIQAYMTKCFSRTDNQIDVKDGGAGLGLFSVVNAIHHFVLNIALGHRTEALGIIELSRTYRQFASKRKSFNVHVAHGF